MLKKERNNLERCYINYRYCTDIKLLNSQYSETFENLTFAENK